MSAEAAGLYLDYSKNRITDETLALLVDLADESGLAERTGPMFAGERINTTENRAVLHVALRMPRDATLIVDGVDVVAQVHEVLDRMAAFSQQVGQATGSGFTGLPITDDRQHRHRRLRPRAGHGVRGAALLCRPRPDVPFRIQCRLNRLRRGDPDLDPAQTLFIVSSKTFTTLETIDQRHDSAGLARSAASARMRSSKHFVAYRTNAEKVAAFGIDTANMFGFWDWVGGRYSMDSAIGLSTMIAIGPEQFAELLAGFHEMDEHFRTAPLAENLPVLLGLLTVWYADFFGVARHRRDAVRAVPEAVPRLPAAADDGVQRQARHAGRHARRLPRPARSTGASRAPTASTASTS